MSHFTDYDVGAYGHMLAHGARISAYVHAIRAAVRPGDVVLDLGTGTGFMALIACQCGARRVYAIEASDGILIAEEAARDNGFEDRIAFLRGCSRNLALPERCDVFISDLRGATPCFSSHLADLMDARDRFLKPDARWICQADTMYVAVADVARRDQCILAQWDGTPWGLNLQAALPRACQQIARRRPDPAELLGPGQPWARIEYPALVSPHVRGSVTLPITRTGPACGLSVWFNAELYGGSGFSVSPDESPGIYSPVFLPWPERIPLQAGDTVEVRIDAVYSGQDYWWRWVSTIRRPHAGKPVATFQQSTFQGHAFERGEVTASSPSHAPVLSAPGEEVRFVLDRIDGQTTQAALAERLRQQFPSRFPNEESAAYRVTEIRRAFAK